VATEHSNPSRRRWALVAVALDLLGMRVAGRHGLVGEPLRIKAPASIPTGLVLAGWGTALSGPLLVDGVLGSLCLPAREPSPAVNRAVRALGSLRLVGVLAEPVTWGRRAPRWTMLIAAGHVVVAVGLLQAATDHHAGAVARPILASAIP
jgi:hypothetical protein